MKIAISSTGPTLDSQIDPRFGRASYFLIVNLDDDSFEAIDNTANAMGAGGVGIQSGQNVVNAGAEWVITGSVGPKAYAVLDGAGVKIASGVTGTVKEAIANFKEGDLKAMSSRDCGPEGVGKPGGMGGSMGGGMGGGRGGSMGGGRGGGMGGGGRGGGGRGGGGRGRR